MKLRVCSADSSAAASGGKPGRVDERVVTAFDRRTQLAAQRGVERALVFEVRDPRTRRGGPRRPAPAG
jgi:hypothetical protein